MSDTPVSKPELRTISFHVSKADAKEQVVTGIVYAPNVIDVDGEFMDEEGCKHACYFFMRGQRNGAIDINHNNRVIDASAVECFLAREGDLEYPPGAWVMSVKIEDAEVWSAIERGDLNGFSFQGNVIPVEETISINVTPQVFGVTKENLGHAHAFVVFLNDRGNILGGYTSETEGHAHTIERGTATAKAGDPPHAHRYSLT